MKKVPLFTCFKTQAKSEDREYTHTGLVFAAILAIASLVPVAGGAILHLVRRSVIGLWIFGIYGSIEFVISANILVPGCKTRTITSLQ